MCGIAGIVRVWPASEQTLALQTPHGHSIPERWLDLLDRGIIHRGPDGRGRYRDRAIRADGSVVDVALVHRRLSILDHAGGHQPMLSLGLRQGVLPGHATVNLGDGLGPYQSSAADELLSNDRQLDPEALRDRICVVFNGCIYNHRQLRAELEQAGHRFSSDHADTEVLVHGFRAMNAGVFSQLDGMFAAAIWSSAESTLNLARDAFGEKPLWMTHVSQRDEAEGLVRAFASEPAPLHRLLSAVGNVAAVDGDELGAWLRFGASGADPCSQIKALSPGTTVDLAAQELVFAPLSWNPAAQAAQPRQTSLSRVEAEQLLLSAVDSRLEADVPIACLLSGGVDSSLVAIMAKRMQRPLKAISVRMPDHRYDESAYAQLVAKHLGIALEVVDCAANPAADFKSAIEQLGLPFGDSSLLPATWAFRAAGQHARVVLGGDGGDELGAGYERYRAAEWLARLGSVLRAMPSFGAGAHPKSKWSKLNRLREASRNLGYVELVSIFPTPELGKLIPGQGGLPDYLHALLDKRPINSAASATQFELASTFPQDLLLKVDAASMSVPVELRSPFLAKGFAHAALSARWSELAASGQRKGLLRAVARQYLPAHVVDRPKMGFAVPIGEWFRSDFGGLRTMLMDHLNAAEPFGTPALGIALDRGYIQQTLDEHFGTGLSGLVRRDHGARLYMLLALSIWARERSRPGV